MSYKLVEVYLADSSTKVSASYKLTRNCTIAQLENLIRKECGLVSNVGAIRTVANDGTTFDDDKVVVDPVPDANALVV